jgi:hypothetical protein
MCHSLFADANASRGRFGGLSATHARSLQPLRAARRSYGVRCAHAVCRKFRVRAITMGKKETSYGETEATGYFRRAARLAFGGSRPEDSLCQGRAARRAEEGICQTSLERRDRSSSQQRLRPAAVRAMTPTDSLEISLYRSQAAWPVRMIDRPGGPTRWELPEISCASST